MRRTFKLRARGAAVLAAFLAGSVASLTLPDLPSASATSFVGELNDVTCLTSSQCMAVGSDAGSLYTTAWIGSSWVSAPHTDPPGTAVQPQGVSCTGASSCLMVGYRSTAHHGFRAFSEEWNGSNWQPVSTAPSPKGASYTYLSSLSCTAPFNCMAVGHYYIANPFESFTLAEKWNGSTWQRVGTKKFVNSNLEGVSCLASTNCTAVGDRPNSSGNAAALVEHWDGTAWHVVAAPAPATRKSFLAKVSCANSKSCVATGNSFASSVAPSRAFSEVWNGSSWTIHKIPIGKLVTATHVLGISCVSPTDCVAVGQRIYTKDESKSLAVHWDGSTWSRMPIQDPSGSPLNNLNGVSCTSNTSCLAVGSQDQSNEIIVSSDVWNGTKWTFAPAD